MQEPKICNYIKSEGTNFPLKEDSKEGKEWFLKFSKLQKSAETGFNWSQLSQQIRHSEIEAQELVIAQPGTIVNVSQVVGYCGGYFVKTGAFKTATTVSEDLIKEISLCTPKDGFEVLITCDAANSMVINEINLQCKI